MNPNRRSSDEPPDPRDSDPRESDDNATPYGYANRTQDDNEARSQCETSYMDTLDLIVESKRRPVLVILEGKSPGKQHILEKEATTLGREIDVEMVLNDGRVSRHHCRIRWENIDRDTEEPRCLLEDLDSRNGVIVNGQRIREHALQNGDHFLVGATLIGFYLKDEKELNVEKRLLAMATTDGLTGLANRAFFETEARREIDRANRYGRPLSILTMDLDHFKRVNDTYGHPAGDTVLRQFSRLLLVTVRQGDLVGRLGGEEFGVLLPETPMVGAVRTAERIRERTERHTFQHKDLKILVTVSIGIAEYSPQYTNRTDFFEAADQALYRAKEAGRNWHCCAPLLGEGTPPKSGANLPPVGDREEKDKD